MRVLGSTGRGPNRRANGRSRNIPCPPLERPSPSARQNRSAPSARRRGKQPFLRQNHADAKGLESGSREREGAPPTCLHGSAPALQAPQRHSIRIFWRVLTEIPISAGGAGRFIDASPGYPLVGPSPPRRISQAGPGRKRISVKTRQKLPSSLSDRRRTEGGTRAAEGAEEEGAGSEGRHALGEGANRTEKEASCSRTAQNAEGARPDGGKRRARRQTANPAEKASQREGPSRSRASTGLRPRVRSARGPGCAILAPSTARDHDRRLP